MSLMRLMPASHIDEQTCVHQTYRENQQIPYMLVARYRNLSNVSFFYETRVWHVVYASRSSCTKSRCKPKSEANATVFDVSIISSSVRKLSLHLTQFHNRIYLSFKFLLKVLIILIHILNHVLVSTKYDLVIVLNAIK